VPQKKLSGPIFKDQTATLDDVTKKAFLKVKEKCIIFFFNKMDLEEGRRVGGGMEWIDLAQGRDSVWYV
jgi:hypothetical protein